MRSSNSAGLNGLVTTKLAPQSRASATRPRRMWLAVMITGMKALGLGPDRRSQRISSNPSMSGMSVSMTSRSMVFSASSRLASAPLPMAKLGRMPKPARALAVKVSENGESSTIIVTAPVRLKTALSRRDSPPLMLLGPGSNPPS